MILNVKYILDSFPEVKHNTRSDNTVIAFVFHLYLQENGRAGKEKRRQWVTQEILEENISQKKPLF